MEPSRIQAVSHVNIDAPLGTEDQLRWFYREVLQLEEVGAGESDSRRLSFRSEQIELRVHLVERPTPDPVPCRMTIAVPSLEEACEQLQEHFCTVERISGMASTDRRLQVIDPGGNRIELKQQWRTCLL